MKVFTSFLFSALLVVVGGWTVVGMQEGQKAYQQHQQSLAACELCPQSGITWRLRSPTLRPS